MKIKELLSQLDPEILEKDAEGIVLIAATPHTPTITGTCSPGTAKRLIEICLSANWLDTDTRKIH